MGEKQGFIRILVVDDHTVVRMGLKAMIDSQPSMQVIGEASNGPQAVELFRRLAPDVVLMDLRLPGMSGIQATKEIRADFPDARVVGLTTYDGDEDIYRALPAGARALPSPHPLRP